MPTLPKAAKRPTVRQPYQQHAVRSKLYDSPLWRKVRRDYLTKHPFCVSCTAVGLYTIATVCDHMVAVRDGAAFFDTANYQGLCKSCHMRKSAKEGQDRRKAVE